MQYLLLNNSQTTIFVSCSICLKVTIQVFKKNMRQIRWRLFCIGRLRTTSFPVFGFKLFTVFANLCIVRFLSFFSLCLLHVRMSLVVMYRIQWRHDLFHRLSSLMVNFLLVKRKKEEVENIMIRKTRKRSSKKIRKRSIRKVKGRCTKRWKGMKSE